MILNYSNTNSGTVVPAIGDTCQVYAYDMVLDVTVTSVHDDGSIVVQTASHLALPYEDKYDLFEAIANV